MEQETAIQNSLEKYFEPFRKNIIGIETEFHSPYGNKKIIYADWIASGRLYRPIENKISELFGQYVGNTHSESSETGTIMTESYHYARSIIKKHVNAKESDVLINSGSGMTGVINKFQRILGLRIPERLKSYTNLPDELKPVVIITHMEHHSNQTSWLESVADVVIIPPNDLGMIDLENLYDVLEIYKERKFIIGSFSACSNVTGIINPIHKMAKLMHEFGGYCFVDFACSAPYVKIDMHPDDEMEKLDAIYFSPHKFLGGPGTPGILIFDSQLYKNKIPDDPGGGTVDWTNPWGQHKYISSIEAREDGGTPPFLQTIKAGLAIKLKEEMGIEKILEREHQLITKMFDGLSRIQNIHLLAGDAKNRLGAISFYAEKIHYNLIVKILNDRFGIQVRGGCSCAGTYGHYLLQVCPIQSNEITDKINVGDLSDKPGWVRVSVHQTMTDKEVDQIILAIDETVKNIEEYSKDYNYSPSKNEFVNLKEKETATNKISQWFEF